MLAKLDDSPSGVGVDVQVTYREPEDLAAEVGEALVARYGEIPVPDAWVGFDASASDSNNPQIGMRYGAPDGFDIDDVETWLDDDATWAAFGELTREPCEVNEDGTWLCGQIMVDAYDYVLGSMTADEFLRVDYDPVTQVVSVTLRLRA